jgi:hypothetical protein
MKTERKSKRICIQDERPYRALNSISTTSTSSGKVPFDGPHGWNLIIRQIVEDGKEQGMDLSYNLVERVIRLFFTRIVNRMRLGVYVKIDELGFLGMTMQERQRRWDAELAAHIRRCNKKRAYLKKLWHRERFKIRWRELMEYRKSKGLEVWSYEQWMKIIGRKL